MWSGGSECSYLASGLNERVVGGSGDIVRSAQNASGLVLSDDGSGLSHRVGVTGNAYTYTDSLNTLSIAIAYDDVGPGAHVTDTFLRTVYAVFPGVPTLVATLKGRFGCGNHRGDYDYSGGGGDGRGGERGSERRSGATALHSPARRLMAVRRWRLMRTARFPLRRIWSR